MAKLKADQSSIKKTRSLHQYTIKIIPYVQVILLLAILYFVIDL
jgi:hypothetical protein